MIDLRDHNYLMSRLKSEIARLRVVVEEVASPHALILPERRDDEVSGYLSIGLVRKARRALLKSGGEE